MGDLADSYDKKRLYMDKRKANGARLLHSKGWRKKKIAVRYQYIQGGRAVRVRIKVNVVFISIIKYPQKAEMIHVPKLFHSDNPIPHNIKQTRITTGRVSLPVAIFT